MERLHCWVSLAALSVVIIGALVDQIPIGSRNGKENFALATACISLCFGILYTIANVVDSLRNRIVGNLVENSIASIVMALWVIAITFIQNPQNGIATTIIDNEEFILFANLYFFSWLTFLMSVYTAGVTFRDNFQFGPKFSQWMLLFTASIVLMSTSISIKGDVCANAGVECTRTKYAVGVGAIGMGISCIAVFASILDKMGRMTELGCSFLATILYFFGVVFLTSASGPASGMGNIYFSVWGGCFVSFMLLIGVLFPGSGSGAADEREDFDSRNGGLGEEDNI